jgi:hypothetical protein
MMALSVMFGFIMGLFKKSREDLWGRTKPCPYCNETFSDETERQIHIEGKHRS